jgi:hypothetical protein
MATASWAVTFGEVLPRHLDGSLDRRLHERARRPPRDGPDVCIPRPRQQTPGGTIKRPAGSRTIVRKTIDDHLVDLDRRDVVRRAEPHQGR